MPACPQDLGELGKLEIILLAGLRLKHVETDREFRIGGLDDNQPFAPAQVGSRSAFLGRQRELANRYGMVSWRGDRKTRSRGASEYPGRPEWRRKYAISPARFFPEDRCMLTAA